MRYTAIDMLDHMRNVIGAYQPRRIERDDLPRAAVLIAIYEKEGVPHIIFQVRTELVEHHKGQISFPGGAEDPGDVDLKMTALRETEEEIGLAAEDVEVWGQIDDIVTISNFVVTPYVGRIARPAPYPFAPSGYEVAELLEVALPHLREPSSLNLEAAPWRDRMVPPPSYSFGDHLIWGATARMLRQFLELTRGAGPAMNRDPKTLAREAFAGTGGCLSSGEIIQRYATDVGEIRATLLDALGPKRPEARICELGFGLGWLLEALAAEFPDATLAGLDLSPGMTAHVRGRLGAKAAIVEGDMERLPFADGAFDAIAACWNLYFMRDIDAALIEIKRVLRPGGRLVAATVAPDNGIELDELTSSAAGPLNVSTDNLGVVFRFDLESGAAYVRRHFEGVELREWRGWLELPDVPTLVRFWEGMYGPILAAGAVERLRPEIERLAKAWLARDGALRVTRHGGAFVGYA